MVPEFQSDRVPLLQIQGGLLQSTQAIKSRGLLPSNVSNSRQNPLYLNQLKQMVTPSKIKRKSTCLLVQVTYLNKICRVHVFLRSQGSSLLRTIIILLINHFSVKLDQISSVHLITTESNELIWSDSQLENGGSYFLCFARKGFNLTPQSIHATISEIPELVALIGKPLFSRDNRNYRVTRRCEYQDGMVEELQLHQQKSNVVGFMCPFFDCAAQFRKSCDLVIHFNVETGNKPYICPVCQQGFRRNILLKHHISQARCMPLNPQSQEITPMLPFTPKQLPLKQQASTSSVLSGSGLVLHKETNVQQCIGSPSYWQIQMQVGQIFKNLAVYLKLQKLEMEGASEDDILLQKLRMSWELSITCSLLNEGA